MRTIVWFRGKDLRISDHAPLLQAAQGGEVIPLFVLDPYFFAPSRAQDLPHRMQFLLQSLHSLQANLRAKGSDLVLVQGRSVELLPALVDKWRADRVVAHRWSEPFARRRDGRVAEALGERFVLHEGETLWPPGTLRTGGGRPYAVFTQFAKNFHRTARVGPVKAAPRQLPPLPAGIKSRADLPTLASLGLSENPRLQPGGERAAHLRLKAFLAGAAARYHEDRDRMDLPGTSRLSADLKFGTISARQVWNAAQHALHDTEAGRAFLNELVWREFAHSTLWDRPRLLQQPFRPEFEGFPWQDNDEGWRAWAEGRTGYPLVDAAAQQLLQEGFVHNRARMISASFLTKHLLIDYRRGEAHYLRYLTDGDWAQNNAGWQWSAGCGCDAQPYFRVFNPITQGKKMDPEGAYVRRWLPALAKLPTKYIHAPWTAPDAVLAQAGVQLGPDYPLPIVDHPTARVRFLDLAKEHLAAAKAASDEQR